MIEGIVYSLYSFLAFAEVAVLLASAIGFFAFVALKVIEKIRSLMDSTVSAEPSDTQPQIRTLHPLGAIAGRRSRQIPGGHNERF
jgi:hypothetical protein